MFQVFLDAGSLQPWLLLRRLPWTRTPTHSPRLWKARSVCPSSWAFVTWIAIVGLCSLSLSALAVTGPGCRASVANYQRVWLSSMAAFVWWVLVWRFTF